jgi:hypothetical protein
MSNISAFHVAFALALLACAPPAPPAFPFPAPQCDLALRDATDTLSIEGILRSETSSFALPPCNPAARLGACVESPPTTRTGTGTDKLPTTIDVDAEVRELTQAKLLGDERLSYGQIQNNCERRAHIALAHILENHPTWLTGKVFVFGKLRPIAGLSKFGWGYHVSPYVVATKDGAPRIFVLDPAFNATNALAVRDWLSASSADSTAKVTGVFLDAGAVLFHGETPDNSGFCPSVTAAIGFLRAFDTGKGVPPRTKHAVVHRIDEDHQHVWFDTPSGHSGYYPYREDLECRLKIAAASKSEIEITYSRVVNGTSGFLGFFKSNFLYVTDVKPDISECPGSTRGDNANEHAIYR